MLETGITPDFLVVVFRLYGPMARADSVAASP